jgi:hypothetical protein
MSLWLEILPDFNWVKRGRVDRSGNQLTPERARFLLGVYGLRQLLIFVAAVALGIVFAKWSLTVLIVLVANLTWWFEQARMTDINEAMGYQSGSIFDADKAYLFYSLLAFLLLGAAFFTFGDPLRTWLGEQTLIPGAGRLISQVWALMSQPLVWFPILLAFTAAVFVTVLKLERTLESNPQ